MSEFQPPDEPAPDYDTLREEMFERYEKCGYAVISRDEWKSKLDEAQKEAYAEGRKDEREELTRLLGWAYGKLSRFSYSKQEDALMLDEINLILLGAQ